jgi:hypothetical protein
MGAEAVAGGVDCATVALALGGASHQTAGAFINDRRGLIADQHHHLHEQFKQLRLTSRLPKKVERHASSVKARNPRKPS